MKTWQWIKSFCGGCYTERKYPLIYRGLSLFKFLGKRPWHHMTDRIVLICPLCKMNKTGFKACMSGPVTANQSEIRDHTTNKVHCDLLEYTWIITVWNDLSAASLLRRGSIFATLLLVLKKMSANRLHRHLSSAWCEPLVFHFSAHVNSIYNLAGRWCNWSVESHTRNITHFVKGSLHGWNRVSVKHVRCHSSSEII